MLTIIQFFRSSWKFCEENDGGPVTMCCIYVQLVDEWLTAVLVESLLSYILYAGCHFGAKNLVRL